MNYSGRIRDPNGALGNSDEGCTKFWRFLILAAIVAVAIYFAWRAGWLGKVASAVAPIANPHGWV